MSKAMKTCLLVSFLALTLTSTVYCQQVEYGPAWSQAKPLKILRLDDASGDALVKAVSSLQPGDRLELPSGTYSIRRLWDIVASGTESSPIWIAAAKDAQVIITRPDAVQNVINIGIGKPVQFLCLSGLEITGGSHGLRLGQCSNVWIDRCHIHHTGEVNLSANSAETRKLYLTSNHLHHAGGHGEGMYLGSHDGKSVMSESVIALNHVHDCAGSQGDGIEIKQGCWGNLIAENHIHDTQYPCITVYGTAGKSVNIIERNLCYRSQDHTMQVQGEAIVRNNVLIAAKGSGFASTDHQGKTVNLQVVHNTIINTGHAFSGGSWNARTGMVLANNILYSRDADAFHFANGHSGVTIHGNVVFTNGRKFDSPIGNGLIDFENTSWDGQAHDVRPSSKSNFQQAHADYLVDTDFFGRARTKPISGAVSQ